MVVPALNESLSIGDVVTSVRTNGWDCLVIDDGSTDNTRQTALDHGALVISLATNLGVGAALRAGFRFAVENGYSRVVQCDADGQHRASLIETLVDTATKENADLVIGSRFISGGQNSMSVAGHRRMVMRWLSWIIKKKSGATILDTTSGFKCVSEPLLTEFASSFPAHFLGDTFEACLVATTKGYKVIEVPVGMDERKYGRSTASAIQATRYILRSIAVAFLGLTFEIAPKEDPA